MRKKGNTVLAGLIICLLLVFLAAAGKLFGAYLKYQKGDVSYEKLQEYVQEPEEEESPESEKEKEEPKNRYLEIDFAGLKAVNPDVIAWIQIPALDISYPVVQGKDNAYYLHHLFSGESNINGSIFVDCHNQPLIHEPVYISIDKDVLRKQDAVTDWTNGDMTLLQLQAVLRIIYAHEEVIGVDITGECSATLDYLSEVRSASVNNKANEELMQMILSETTD